MVLEELKKLGIEENTIIIFSSDNGYFNGSHGLGSKVLPYEEGARVPLIIVDPRDKDSKGKRSESITGNVDIAATILDYAGVKTPAIYDGTSLVPIIKNSNKKVREYLPIIQVFGPKATQCLTVMDDQFKYVYWFYKDEKNAIHPTEELFDIKNDPYEMKNLIADSAYKKQLKKMRKLYDVQLNKWKKEGVKKNGYEKYESLFVRNY